MADGDKAVPLTGAAVFDQDLYGTGDKFAGFNATLVDEDDDDQNDG